MHREGGAGAAQSGCVSLDVEGAEPAQERNGCLERAGRRRVEPGDLLRVEPGGPKLQDRAGQVEALDLGRMMLRPGVEIVAGVEADGAPGSQPARPASALRGGRAADLPQVERRQARPGRM